MLSVTFKKLVLVLTTFALVTKASKKDNDIILNRTLYIHYLLCFCKNKKNKLQALINSYGKINAMTLAYALELSYKVCQTNIKAQKINGSTFKIFEMVLASFEVEDKFKKAYFFQETFLLANTSVKIVLGMLFFIFSNANI